MTGSSILALKRKLRKINIVEFQNLSPRVQENLELPIPGTRNFIWREALWLPRWGIAALPSQVQVENIVDVASRLQRARTFLGNMPIRVTSWLRPTIYNAMIGGAEGSAHLDGAGVDFLVVGLASSEVRRALRPKLDEFGLRMENLETPHVHVDTKVPGVSGRFFIP